MSQITINTSAKNRNISEPVITNSHVDSGIVNVKEEESLTGTVNEKKEDISMKGVYYQEVLDLLKEVREKNEYSGQSIRMLQERPSINEDAINSRQLSAQVMENALAGLAKLDLSEEEISLLKSTYTDMSEQVSDKVAIASDGITAANSEEIWDDKEICEFLSALMMNANDKYLKIFEHAVKVQNEYWKKFTSIQAMLTDWISTDKDKIKFKEGELRNMLTNQLSVDNYVLYPEEGVLSSKEEAVKWAKELGAAKVLRDIKTGGYQVVPDYTPVINIINQLSDGTVSLSPTEYQAWLTGFNNQAENIKTNNQTITTKYSSANSLYDSLIKLLSTSITSLFDSCKEYMRW